MPKNPAVTAAEAAELDVPLTETTPPTFSQRAAGLFGTVRDNPRTAIAAGAVLAAGVAAATAIPLARSRARSKANGSGKPAGGTGGAATAKRAPTRRRAAPKKKG
jgi:hypothetical protein